MADFQRRPGERPLTPRAPCRAVGGAAPSRRPASPSWRRRFPTPASGCGRSPCGRRSAGSRSGIGPTVGGALVVGRRLAVGLLHQRPGVRASPASSSASPDLIDSLDPKPPALRPSRSADVGRVAGLPSPTGSSSGSHPVGSGDQVAGPLGAAAVLARAVSSSWNVGQPTRCCRSELFHRNRLFSSTALVTFLLGFVMLSVPFFTPCSTSRTSITFPGLLREAFGCSRLHAALPPRSVHPSPGGSCAGSASRCR